MRTAALRVWTVMIASLWAASGPQRASAAPPPSSSRPTTRKGSPAGLLDLVPAEALLCWRGRPARAQDLRPKPASPLEVLLAAGSRIFAGQLDAKARLTLDLFGALGQVFRRPFVIALLDARAEPTGKRPGSRRVADLKLVVAVRVQDDASEMLKIVQRLINAHTDSQNATLVTREVLGFRYQELTDRRLPDWARFAWGRVGRFFVVTVGRDVWPQVARVASGQSASLLRDGWVRSVRQAYAPDPLIEVYVAARRIRERLDPFVDGRASAFFNAFGAGDIDRSHWALGFRGRALYCLAHHRIGRRTVRRMYADPATRDARLLAVVPAGARYAVYHLPMRSFLPRLIRALYATRSPAEQKLAAERWRQVEQRLGLSAQHDALDYLGDYIVLHNDPPHPLRMPLAFTTLIEIREQPQRVRATLEKLCGAWQAALEKDAREKRIRNPARLYRDEDGIWFVQFGPVAGVAWTFTDRFIVTSWSPDALRSYLEKAGNAIGRR